MKIEMDVAGWLWSGRHRRLATSGAPRLPGLVQMILVSWQLAILAMFGTKNPALRFLRISISYVPLVYSSVTTHCIGDINQEI